MMSNIFKSDIVHLDGFMILVYINVDSAAIACLGGMYEKLGRMVGRSYEETISLLVKALKNAEVAYVFLLNCKTSLMLDSVTIVAWKIGRKKYYQHCTALYCVPQWCPVIYGHTHTLPGAG